MMRKLSKIILSGFALACSSAWCCDVTTQLIITVTPPTTYVDNTPLPAGLIGGYVFGINGVEYPQVSVPSFTHVLATGEHIPVGTPITARAVTTYGNSSAKASMLTTLYKGPLKACDPTLGFWLATYYRFSCWCK